MTEKDKANLVSDARAVVETIKKQYSRVQIIKDCMIPPLVNIQTGKTTGFAVQIQLNTRYNSDEFMLMQWKEMLNAESWYITARRCKLHVIFKVRYEED
ncbi:MAG: hypothetical protein LIR46_14245 [Bacteroidota bacterium]|nr:hypothetical protein [Bacteroidota bacterium]